MTIKAIIEQHLIDGGFDGLWNRHGTCACKLDDLFPCDCHGLSIIECAPGFFAECDCGDECEYEFHIGPGVGGYKE